MRKTGKCGKDRDWPNNSRAANDGGCVLALGARDGHLVVEAGQKGGHVAVGQAHELASIEVPLILGVRVAGKAESRDQCGANLRIIASPSSTTAEGKQTPYQPRVQTPKQ